MQQGGYFSSVKESDHGVYTCTRTYLYNGQIYNMTFTVVLDVQTNSKTNTLWQYFSSWKFRFSKESCKVFTSFFYTEKSIKFEVITSPQMNDTIYVELGEPPSSWVDTLLLVINTTFKCCAFSLFLGSTVVVDCKAVTYSDSEVYWLSGESFVDTNDSLPVFYNYTE